MNRRSGRYVLAGITCTTYPDTPYSPCNAQGTEVRFVVKEGPQRGLDQLPGRGALAGLGRRIWNGGTGRTVRALTTKNFILIVAFWLVVLYLYFSSSVH
jgi:hypothetical protein